MALDLLWRSPPERAIRSVAAGERRAFFAAKIRELADAFGDDVYRDLPLPRLRRLTLRVKRRSLVPNPAQRHYIGPQLQELRGCPTHYVLEALIEQRPRLRVIEIVANDSQLLASADRLADFIGSCQQLESLCLMCKPADHQVMLRRLLPMLARHQHLARLRLGWGFMPGTLLSECLQQQQQQQRQDVAAKSFPRVESLVISTTPSAAMELVSTMPALTRFVLYTSEAPLDVLPSIALLPTHQQLRFLHLCSWGLQISWSSLMVLRSLTKLKEFTIHATSLSWSSTDGIEHITGEHLHALLTPLTQLRTLCIGTKLPILTDVLGAVGEACPTLATLQLSGMYDLRALAHAQRPCLPNLERPVVSTLDAENYKNM